MPLTVRFMGLCMFIAEHDENTQSGTGVQVLLPDTSTGQQRDGTHGNPHYAYLYLPDASAVTSPGLAGPDYVVPLDHEHVQFDFTGAPQSPMVLPAAMNPGLWHGIHLSRFASDLDVAAFPGGLHADRRIAWVELEGGLLGTRDADPGAGPWLIDGTLGQAARFDVVPEEIWWCVTGATAVTVHFQARPEHDFTLDLTGDVEMLIGNLDEPDPTKWMHLPQPAPCQEPPCCDPDFKWFYWLLEGVTSTIEDRLPKDGRLPVPCVTTKGGEAKGGEEPKGITTPPCLGLVYP